MADLTIITNHHPRDLLSLWDLSEEEREAFDYVSEDDGHMRFVRYRRRVYDVQEFVRIVPRSRTAGFAHAVEEDSPLLAWDGIQTDSFFSGIVLRYVPDTDFEQVVVGLAMS